MISPRYLTGRRCWPDHFALETHAREIAATIREFLARIALG